MIYSQPGMPRIFAGTGSLKELPRLLEPIAAESIGIVTDRAIAQSGLPERVRDVMPSGVTMSVSTRVQSDPAAGAVDAIVDELRDGPSLDLILGLGGGSSLDTAKLVAVLLAQGGKVGDIVAPETIHRRLSLILIPTTARTGSEVTPNAIVLLNNAKRGIISDRIIPDGAILDPELTVSLPPAITASTGMDALAHAVEAYLSKGATPLSEAYSLSAVRLISRSLQIAYSHPANIQARERMLIASMLGGLALTIAGTVAVHALGYALGVRYHLPHGVANSIALVPVLSYCRAGISAKLHALSDAVGLGADGDFFTWLDTQMDGVNLERDLGATHASTDDIADLSRATLKIERLMANHPVELGDKDVRSVFRSIVEPRQ